TEEERTNAGVLRFHQTDKRRHVTDVVRERVDIEPLAVGLATAPQIECGHGVSGCDKLLADPGVVSAVRVEARDDDDKATRREGRPPRSVEDLEPPNSCKRSLAGRVPRYLGHVTLLLLSLHPFPHVARTVLQPRATAFTRGEESDASVIDDAQVLEVEGDRLIALGIEQGCQLDCVICCDITTERQHHGVVSRRSLNAKRHGQCDVAAKHAPPLTHWIDGGRLEMSMTRVR